MTHFLNALCNTVFLPLCSTPIACHKFGRQHWEQAGVGKINDNLCFYLLIK